MVTKARAGHGCAVAHHTQTPSSWWPHCGREKGCGHEQWQPGALQMEKARTPCGREGEMPPHEAEARRGGGAGGNAGKGGSERSRNEKSGAWEITSLGWSRESRMMGDKIRKN